MKIFKIFWGFHFISIKHLYLIKLKKHFNHIRFKHSHLLSTLNSSHFHYSVRVDTVTFSRIIVILLDWIIYLSWNIFNVYFYTVYFYTRFFLWGLRSLYSIKVTSRTKLNSIPLFWIARNVASLSKQDYKF